MKLGLISDIHADYAALEQALELLLSQAVDKIICMGDLVEKGLEGDRVIDLLQAWLIPCVRGNHDELALVNQELEEFPLAVESLAYLQALPFSRDYLWDKQRILMLHGSPQSNWDYLLPTSPKKTYMQIAAETDADVIFSGHTHTPMHLQFAGVHFVNAGSICGTNTGGSRSCATFDLSSYQFRVFDLS